MKYILIILCLVLCSCDRSPSAEKYICGEGWMVSTEDWKEVRSFSIGEMHYTEFHLKRSDHTEVRFFKREKLQTFLVSKKEAELLMDKKNK